MRHDHCCPGPHARPAAPVSRRDFLWRSGGGLGGIALASVLGAEGLLKASTTASSLGLHHAPKAKRVIQLFMNGGASQCDTFDYKPELIKRHGQKFDPGPGVVVEAATSQPGTVLKSPWEWKQHGQCGRWVTNAFPHVATCVDDLAFLMAMNTPTSEHSGAVLRQVSGFLAPGFPCLGSWVSYGLGRLSENLPAFVVLPDPRGLPYNAKGAFSSGFLPVSNSATMIKANAPTPIEDLFPPKDAKYVTPDSEAAGLALLDRLNRQHLQRTPGDSRLDARIESYELAARMQLSAPEVMDLANETQATKNLYGLNEARTEPFGTNCLIARRMLERGVRFVQVWSGMDGATGNWDNHGNVKDDLAFIAGMVDRPIAGLLRDLKSRGMLDDTLVIWTTEFGRHPFAQASTGRDHNGRAFCTWLAGAGIKGGTSYGQTDEWSWKAAVDTTTAHDLHATVLHLLGIDHERLTFYNNGVDRRLTDVHGHVIKPILA
jgi:hypothetical protein